MERIWEKFLTDRDREVLTASGYGSHGGFGKKPALLVIDVSYGFTGDKPEPILDLIKQWRNSCGTESWTAIAVIKDLADLFRSKRLPVIYSTGFLRQDNWDAGGWAWKNNRTAESRPWNPLTATRTKSFPNSRHNHRILLYISKSRASFWK